MDLMPLRYAVAVGEEGTFTAAAAACFVAQPSLSQAVRNLERELGVELFTRLPRRARPTAAGEAFLAAARRALHAVDAIRLEVAAVSGLISGHVDLVALPTLAQDPVAGIVGAFCVAHPGVTVRLAQPDGTADLLEAVRDGRSEIGITVGTPADDGRLVSRPLGRQEIVAVLPPGGPRRRRITAAALAAMPLVVQPVGTATRALLDDLLAAAGSPPIVAVETDQREAIVPLVSAGAGAAVLPRSMAVAAGADAVQVVSIHPVPWRRLVLVHRPGALSPAGAALAVLATAPRDNLPGRTENGGRR